MVNIMEDPDKLKEEYKVQKIPTFVYIKKQNEVVDTFETQQQANASEALGQNEVYENVDEPRSEDDTFNLKNNQE